MVLPVMWSWLCLLGEKQRFRWSRRHITNIVAWMGRPSRDRVGHDRACSLERTDDGGAIEHDQQTSFLMVDGQARLCRRTTRTYVAIRREITRDFSKEDQRAPHKRLGHITSAGWWIASAGSAEEKSWIKPD